WIVQHRHVEQALVVGIHCGSAVGGHFQVHAPTAWTGRLEAQTVGKARERRAICHGAAAAGCDPHHDRLRSTVLEKLLHGIAQRAVAPQSAELPLIVRKTEEGYRLIDRATPCAADECGNRSRYTGDRTRRARQLLDVNTRMAQDKWHRILPGRRSTKAAVPVASSNEEPLA